MKLNLRLTALLLAAAAPALANKPDYAPGEVIVQMKDTTSNLHRDAALARAHARILEHLSRKANGNGHANGLEDGLPPGLLRLATDMSVEAAVAELQKDPDVEFAEPNYLCHGESVANDTYYTGGSLWGMYGDDQPTATGGTNTTNQYGIQAEKAWANGQTGSRSVYVGIVDEGMQFAHPDLAANAWTNPFDPVDGVDNDGNGYVDDVHGWDFYEGNNSVYDSTGDDHATHVAGTIGGVGGNGAGVAGVCWNVTMISTKFLGPDSGRISDAVKALDYLTQLKVRKGLNIVATNNSWSTTGYSQALNDAVLRAAKQNILVIAAAGNSTLDNDSNSVYPANFDTTRGTSTQSAATYDAVISVAAIDRTGALASFSDFGATSVDLGAPGVSIPSTLPDSRYGSYSGTSMATPHVTGAAALIAAARPGITASELRQAILSSVIPTASLAGKCVTGGRLNVGAVGSGTTGTPTHDVAVQTLNVTSPALRGSVQYVTTRVANEGTASETFSVAMTDVPPAGGVSGLFSVAQTVTLSPGTTRTLTFTWNLGSASLGTHGVTASASRLNGETDTADNTMSRSVLVTTPPVITSVLPAGATGGTAVTVTIAGSNLRAGATVGFANGGGTAPVAGNVVVASNGLSLTARIQTYVDPQRLARTWDVLVTNPDGAVGRKAQAFRVNI